MMSSFSASGWETSSDAEKCLELFGVGMVVDIGDPVTVLFADGDGTVAV